MTAAAVLVLLLLPGSVLAHDAEVDRWLRDDCLPRCESARQTCVQRSFGKSAMNDCGTYANRCRRDCQFVATWANPSATSTGSDLSTWGRQLEQSPLGFAQQLPGSR